MNHYTLTQLTCLPLPPTETIPLAAKYGYSSVSIRMLQITQPGIAHSLMDDPKMLRETKCAIKDTGVGVHEVEFIKLTRDMDIPSFAPFFATGAELGAKWVVCGAYDDCLNRIGDNFGAVCDLAAQFDMGVVLEFFPWVAVNSLQKTNAIVEATGRANAAILVDTLHMDRCGNTAEDLAAIPVSRLPFVQICDAPAERPTTQDGLFFQSRVERLPPGKGGIEIKRVLDGMPKGIPIGLEVPMTAKAEAEGFEAVIRDLIADTRRFLND
jgi:sugar phosphate isomerase/epimerase